MTTNWVGWMLSLVILLLLFLTGYMLQNSVRLLVTGKRAKGIVVGLHSSSRFPSTPGEAPLLTPLVDFFTADGEHIRVSGRSYSSTPSAQVGAAVKVAYSRSDPKNAQILSWKELPIGPVGFVLGFAVLIILLWISGILVTSDSSMDDPFHLLPAIISHFRLNPFRFPVLFILSLAIPSCLVGTYWTYQIASDLRANGIKAVGLVTGTERVYSKSNDGTTGSGVFPMIVFEDTSGTPHTIRRSLGKPLSRLKAGDKVEVIYLASKPDQGRVNTWDEFWPYPLFFSFMGIAFLVLLRLVLSGYIKDPSGEAESQKKLMTSGVPVIATVLSVDPKTRHLHYRIDKDTRIPAKKLEYFISLENEISNWAPSPTGMEIKKGDQFRAYLDSLKPLDFYYIDFNQQLESNRFVKSMEEE